MQKLVTADARVLGACPKFCVRGITNAEEAYYAKQSQEG